MKPGCGHYLYPEFLQGREAECPVCKEPFVLSYEDTRRRIPHCPSCRTRNDGDAHTPKHVEQKKTKTKADLIAEYKRLVGGY